MEKDNDESIHPISQHGRHGGGKEQDEDDGALELVEQESQRRRLLPGPEQVGPELCQVLPGLGRAQPIGCAVQCCQQAIRCQAPVQVGPGVIVGHGFSLEPSYDHPADFSAITPVSTAGIWTAGRLSSSARIAVI